MHKKGWGGRWAPAGLVTGTHVRSRERRGIWHAPQSSKHTHSGRIPAEAHVATAHLGCQCGLSSSQQAQPRNVQPHQRHAARRRRQHAPQQLPPHTQRRWLQQQPRCQRRAVELRARVC